MESMTNGKDNDNETVEAAETNQDNGPTTETEARRWPPSRRAKIIGGVGAAGLLAAGVGGLLYRDNWNDNREAGRERDEAALLEELRDEGLPLRAGQVVLHEGVKVRETPHTVGSNAWIRSNVDHEIGPDEVLVVPNPIIADRDGVIWMGFSSESPSEEQRSVRQLTQDLRWINLGALEIENEGRDQPYVEYIEIESTELPSGSTIDGTIDRFGNVHMPGSESPVAVAIDLEEWELEALGISPNQE